MAPGRGIAALGVEVVAVAGDVTTSVVILEMVAAAIDAFGKIDIVVNNVGGGSAGDIDDKDNPLAEVEAIWDGTYAMSLKAPVLMCEAVMPHFIKEKSGKIINISSISGRSGMPHVDLVPVPASYHSMKAGLIRYTQVLADQVGRHNINVNAICPGYVDTPMLQSFFGDSGDIESLRQAGVLIERKGFIPGRIGFNAGILGNILSMRGHAHTSDQR